ncbi:MAG TPA: hypothetical protein VMU54_02440 [Planctomycetota bacterium]|nr:hypothetical protein [Planctomycetota bacterium]
MTPKKREKEYYATILAVTGFKQAKLHLLGNLSPKVSDPDSITSFVCDLDFGADGFTADPIHDMESWVVGMDETPKGTIVAVSMDGELFSFRGGTWTVQDLGCPDGIMAIWAAAEGEYFAAGAGGERVRISGRTVDLNPEREKRSLNNVHGTSAKDVVMVGDDGAIFRFDGKTWRELEAPTNQNLLGLYCRSAEEVYISGPKGTLFRSDGDDWEEIEAPDVTFYAVAWFRDALYLAAGKDGIFVLGKEGPEPFKKLPAPIHGLSSIAGSLIAFGGEFLVRYDGKEWTGGVCDF